MDQPKMERLLRIIQLLSSNTNYTIDEIADKLGMSRRTLYRYLDTLKSAGFVVQRSGEGVYKLLTYSKEYTDISQLVYFSEEEAVVLSHLIESLDSTNSLKAGLKNKLSSVYDSTSISDYISDKDKSEVVETLANAIRWRHKASLKGYASSHSGRTKDYVIEPYKFTTDFADVIAFDEDAGMSKVFKIARVGSAEILPEPWENEVRHVDKPIDSFRMSGSGEPLEHVVLAMSLKAKNLLTEEFPVTAAEVCQQGSVWIWEGDVNALEGVGRFVIGLAREIRVLEGAKLKAWLAAEGAYITDSFRNS